MWCEVIVTVNVGRHSETFGKQCFMKDGWRPSQTLVNMCVRARLLVRQAQRDSVMHHYLHTSSKSYGKKVYTSTVIVNHTRLGEKIMPWPVASLVSRGPHCACLSVCVCGWVGRCCESVRVHHLRHSTCVYILLSLHIDFSTDHDLPAVTR